MKTYQQFLTESKAQEAYQKAIDLDQRIPELEEIIKTDPWMAFCYAKWVVKGRWPEAEDILIKTQYQSGYFKFLRDSFIWLSEAEKQKWLQDNVFGYEFQDHSESILDFPKNTIQILEYLRQNISEDLKKELQEYVIKHRPDLILKIEDLDLELKAKYSHEEELGGLDL